MTEAFFSSSSWDVRGYSSMSVGTMPDRVRSEYDATWIKVARKVQHECSNSHLAVTTANCKQVQNAANEARQLLEVECHTVFCQVSEARNSKDTWLSQQVSNHCSDGLQLLRCCDDCFYVRPRSGGSHRRMLCRSIFFRGPSVHYLPSSQTSGRLPSLCCHK